MGVFTMSRLGRQGRWGNQVFQYMFLRTYAKRYKLDYQCSTWVGQIIMNRPDPPITQQLPLVHETRNRDKKARYEAELGLTYPPADNGDLAGKDYIGYCQYFTEYYRPDREFIRDLFVPAETSRLDRALDQLRGIGNTLVGIHLRRGDTGRLIYYLTPNEWYLRWLGEYWERLDKPVLFIASEVPEDREAFAAYNPIMASDLMNLSSEPYQIYNYLQYELDEPTPVRMDWFPDWWLLSRADIMLIGNSTFSFSAALMNRGLRELWRSRLSTQKFELTDPWNAWPLIREDLRDYTGIADTWYDRNPHWDRAREVARW